VTPYKEKKDGNYKMPNEPLMGGGKWHDARSVNLAGKKKSWKGCLISKSNNSIRRKPQVVGLVGVKDRKNKSRIDPRNMIAGKDGVRITIEKEKIQTERPRGKKVNGLAARRPEVD